MSRSLEAQTWQDVYFTSQDGLRLHARYYPAPRIAGRPRRRAVLCLAGLTENCHAFHVLAGYLSDPRNPEARDVLALDCRGRGRSEWDPAWRNYTLEVEMRDALDLLTLAGCHDVAVVGSSRGGLIALAMATHRPSAVGAVVLNDIGPAVEREGLVRLIAQVGRMPLPVDWSEAVAMIRDLNLTTFPAIPAAQWEDIARQWLVDGDGRPLPGHDPKLSRAVSLIEGPLPTIWPQFDALRRVPTMVIRGELSDLLAAATVAEMTARRPDLVAVTVRGQGHAPMLRDRTTLAAIAGFLGRADAVQPLMEKQRRTA